MAGHFTRLLAKMQKQVDRGRRDTWAKQDERLRAIQRTVNEQRKPKLPFTEEKGA